VQNRNIEKRKAYLQQYVKDHKEQRKQYYQQWLQTPAGKQSQAKYDKSEKGKKRHNRYNQTLIGKQANIKKSFKRRDLGFIPLNDYFEGAEGHHISQNFVIYIPQEIHQSIAHNIWSGRNMDAINKLAMEWL
jgi:hypothetical protein